MKFSWARGAAGICVIGLAGCAHSGATTTAVDAAVDPNAPLPVGVAETPLVPTPPEASPSGAAAPQAVTVSLKQVGEALELPRGELVRQTQILAKILTGGKAPRGICPEGENTQTAQLCAMIDLYGASGANTEIRGPRERPIRLTRADLERAQSYGFQKLVSSLSRISSPTLMEWTGEMLKSEACPRNLSAAALRRIENDLPDPAVIERMEALYAHASECLKPEDEGYEATHLRQALLRVQWGHEDTAREAIEKAVQAESSTDRSRALYWAGRLQTDPKERERYWGRLVNEFPLSFHALAAWTALGQDPLEIFNARPVLSLSRFSENKEIDLSMRWLEALYIKNYSDAAQKLALWITESYGTNLTPSLAFYISALKSTQGTPFNTITFLSRQVSGNPAMLNRQTLQLLFPQAYYDTFHKHSPETDTWLVLSVARQESGFNPNARSAANARGLLQLLPSTARLMSGRRRENLYDSEVNARLGVKFLTQLIDKFQSVELALAAYNAGPGRIPDWQRRFPTENTTLFMDLIPFRETRNYVSNIVRNNYWYRRLYDAERNPSPVTQTSPASYRRSQLVTSLVEAHELASKH
jgi:soluble lytic murein transglycosylase-like protein